MSLIHLCLALLAVIPIAFSKSILRNPLSNCRSKLYELSNWRRFEPDVKLINRQYLADKPLTCNASSSVPSRFTVNNPMLGNFKFSLEDRRFDIQITNSNSRFNAESSLTINEFKLRNGKQLQTKMYFENITVDVEMEVTLTQQTERGCRYDEELFGGLCFKKCSILTGGTHPVRSSPNTCSRRLCHNGNDLHYGICHPNCRSGYDGYGPSCSSSCRKSHGPSFENTLFACRERGRMNFNQRDLYGHGRRYLANDHVTKGIGCFGYGVNGDGKCPSIRYNRCYTSPYYGRNGPCRPVTFPTSLSFKLSKSHISVVSDLEVWVCKESMVELKRCRDVGMASILMATLGNNFASLNNFLERVERLSISSLDIDPEDIVLNYLGVRDKSPVNPNFSDAASDLLASLVRKNSKIYKLLLQAASERAMSDINSYIDTNISKHSTKRCPHSKRVRIVG